MSRYEWDGANPGVERLKQAVNPARNKVISHPIVPPAQRVGRGQ